MKAFKKKVQTRIWIFSLLAVGVVLLYIGFLIYRPQLPVLSSFVKGFHQGIFLGLEVIIVGFLVRNVRAIKSEDALRKLHIEETDERTGQIIQNAATLGISIVLFGLALATAVAGFFNMIAFLTLLGTLLFMLILFFSLWGYYAKRI